MIDTVSVATSDFEVANSNRLTKRTDVLETGEILEKQFYNSDKLNLTIDSRGFRLHFSLPKLYGLQDNFYPLGANSFETAMDGLQRNLEDVGVIADLDTMKILRLDIFKNVETSETFSIYSDVLRTLELKRTHRRDYTDGFLTANTLRELCFYNKVRELSESLGSLYVRQVYNFSGENIIRGELRFLRHSEVKKNGFDYLNDIKANWNLLKGTYSNYMSEVFKYDFTEGGEIELNEATLRALVNFAKSGLITQGRGAIKYFGYYPFIYMNRNELKEALSLHYRKREVFNILSDIERYKKKYSVLYKSLDYKNLYSELKEKFLNN